MLRDIEAEVELTSAMIGKSTLHGSVMDAIKSVPRHEFIPRQSRVFAYHNGPVSIGHGQTISQPFIVALMTDLLDPEPDDVMLEVGTGSCYQAAVLSGLVKKVYTVEIVPKLAERAAGRLRHLGYDNVEIRAADGSYGWPDHAPFDGIIVTAAAPSVPQTLIDQLKEGANLVIPVGQPYHHQLLKQIHKTLDGQINVRDILGVAFVPLTGEHGCDPAC